MPLLEGDIDRAEVDISTRQNRESIVDRGREVLRIEGEALERVAEQIGSAFSQAVQLLQGCRGKVVLTGIGKSGIIAQKMTATLNSTGTPALYLHPIDALHGDLGVVQRGDIVILFSKSGESEEINRLYPALRALETPVIAITGNTEGQLARMADITLDVSVEREACPHDLAPTASTTAMLGLADALSVVLYERKGFTREDFASTHPGGAIGRRLLLRIEDLMKTGEDMPVVVPDQSFNEVIVEMSQKRLGAALVVEGEYLCGIITDGDLRRILQREEDVRGLTAREMMTSNPMRGNPSLLGTAALQMLEEKKRTQLPITDSDGRLVGIVHIHDLIEAGLRS
ncbi:MAG: KpsF/GutQ family sugar-phosphate isomerase [Ignavibacteriae bacterium]|nr:KpsF/GutQ family sugar-phosphate isomerase [Ignavibacteriota bacterium]MCB9216883.1 KpsF/GutQ family sugar-phosphate isomerase [Ignavibacteria bacterium]